MTLSTYGAERWEALRAQAGPSGPYVLMDDAEVFGALDLSRSGLEAIRKAVEEKDFGRAYAAWSRYWAARKNPVWVFDPEAYRQAMKEEMSWLVPVIVEQADKVLARDIVTGTYHAKSKGRTFDWAADNGDSAYIGWHYFFWFRALPRAYLLTGDERYAKMAADIAVEWYEALPDIRKFDAVVWNSMLGSSLRATYLLEAYCLLRKSPALTPEAHAAILRILLGHARYVYDKHMKKYTFWNGQNSAAAWLTTAYTMLPEFKEAKAWRAATLPIIRRHLEEDFRADGGQSELCEQYHMTGLRDLWTALRLMQRNDDLELISDAALMAKFHKALLWPLALSLPDGHTPALNSGTYASEWLIFAGLSRAFFDDPTLRWAIHRFVKPGWVPVQKGFPPTCFWLIDETFAAALRDRHPAQPPPFTSVLLPHSGFGVLRDSWESDSSVLVLDFGRPTGGHGYPGKLSFVLYARGAPVALQPGSPLSYSLPVYSKWCYQTISHNTIVVNGRSPKPPFYADLERWHDLKDIVFFGARTEVYKKTDGVVHRRYVTFLPREYFVILDLISGATQDGRLSWMFHCPSPLTVDSQKRAHTPPGKAGVLIVPAKPEEIIEVVQGIGHSAVPVFWTPQYKPEHSFRDDVPYIGYGKVIKGTEAAQYYEVMIAPFGKKLPDIVVRALRPKDMSSPATGLIAAWPMHTDWHMVKCGERKTAEWENVSTDAACVFLRFPLARPTASQANPDGLPTRFALVGASRLQVNARTLFEAGDVQAIFLQRTQTGWRGWVESKRAVDLKLLAPSARRSIVAGRETPPVRDGEYVIFSVAASGEVMVE